MEAVSHTSLSTSVMADLLCQLGEIKTLATLCRVRAQEIANIGKYATIAKSFTSFRDLLSSRWHSIKTTSDSCNPLDITHLSKRIDDTARDLVRLEWVLNRSGAPLTSADDVFFGFKTYLPAPPVNEPPTPTSKEKTNRLKVITEPPAIEIVPQKDHKPIFSKIANYWKDHSHLYGRQLVSLSKEKELISFSKLGSSILIVESEIRSHAELYHESKKNLAAFRITIVAVMDLFRKSYTAWTAVAAVPDLDQPTIDEAVSIAEFNQTKWNELQLVLAEVTALNAVFEERLSRFDEIVTTRK